MPATSIKKRHEFIRIQRKGARAAGDLVTVFQRPKSNKNGRLGLTAAKSLGKAHERNLFKRRIRHLFSIHPELLVAHDMVVIGQDKAPSANFGQLELDLLASVARLSPQRRPTSKSNSHRSKHDKRKSFP